MYARFPTSFNRIKKQYRRAYFTNLDANFTDLITHHAWKGCGN